MYDIEMHSPSGEFRNCCRAAAGHLEACSKEVTLNWLKADLIPPFLEHMSFRLGNQLFFIRLVDVEGRLSTPGNPEGVLSVADGCRGHACLMRMMNANGKWQPVDPGWGLKEARSGKSVDPAELVSDEKIEMTDWELQDFGVQVVRNHITDELGFDLMSSQGNPDVNPSLWFVGPEGPQWVAVRAVRYPELAAALPENIREIAASVARQSGCDSIRGHFASVSFAHGADESGVEEGSPVTPLWRGHGMFVRFDGLSPISLQ